jgi:hypothetical protein
MLSEKEKRVRLLLKNSFVDYARVCLGIRTKEGQVKRLELNKAQRHMHDCLERQLQEKGKIRALILKGRQQGCSTYVEARFYWKVSHRHGVRAFILTHLDEATQNLYAMVKRYHELCPQRMRPSTSASNARELVFDKLDSSYRVGTARSQGTGRSDTIQFFHGSEVAFWPNAEEHVSGVLQAIPNLPGTEVILESTSDGAKGLFHAMCVAAEKGLNDYQLIFVPWYWQDEYRLPCGVDFVPTEEERQLQEQYGLDDQQICWRRNKIAEFSGDISRFRREYPSSVEEAFATEVKGALWTRETLHKNRVGQAPELTRIVVAIDPAATSLQSSDETGIVVCGIDAAGHGYVLADISGHYTPSQWAHKAVTAYYQFNADRIIAESNNGGEMVEHTIRTHDPSVPIKCVHASRGKYARAEPVAALDEQGKIHHVGTFSALEDQLCSWVAGGAYRSPDRLDARVWAFTELMLSRQAGAPRIWG